MYGYLLNYLLFVVLLLAPQSGRVFDQAQILSQATINELAGISASVESETSAEFAIVTVPSLQGKTVEEFSNELFNQWGIGKRGTNNGVLFLVAPHERRTRIEVGYGLEELLSDSLCGEILDTDVIPQFKNGDYAEGVRQGALRIAEILRAHPQAARGIPGSAPFFVETPYRNSQLFIVLVFAAAIVMLLAWSICAKVRYISLSMLLIGGGLLLILTVVALHYLLNTPQAHTLLPFAWGGSGVSLLALFDGVRRYRRYGPHRCKFCSTELTLLDEKTDDGKIDKAQLLEEQLGSVDYDVWFCPACLKDDVKRYVSFFSGFTDCIKCNHRTFKEVETVMLSPTYYSSGKARVDGQCYSCRHTSIRYRTLPKRTRSSSSSGGGGGGGGFGGGSSGGGGSSRSW